MKGPRHRLTYTSENTDSVTRTDARLRSPSFSRNYAPIRDALRRHLTGPGSALEIGSGTGQHIAHLAGDFPGLDWTPSDFQPEHRVSIAAWRAELGHANLAAPIHIDAAGDWAEDAAVRDLGPLAGVLACNVIHIAPWAVAEGLVRGAAQALRPGALLILYGPYREGGIHTGEGNASFDAHLQAENPLWGVRDLDDVAAMAAAAGFGSAQVTRMPSNNLIVAFAKA